MHIEIMSLADAATNSQGKINILGSFDTIFGEKIPVPIQFYSLAIKIRRLKGECDPFKITVTYIDPLGKPFQNPFSLDIPAPPLSSDESTSSNIVINYQNVLFPLFGEYKVVLKIDGEDFFTLPLYVKILERN